MDYSYTVTRIDQESKCMDVEFVAEGFEPIVVGVRLPMLGEDVDAVIKAFAPRSVWNPPVVEYATVAVGTSGSFVEPSIEAVQQEEENTRMWAAVEFEKQVAKALVKFGLLTSDPTEIPVAQL